jgi:hypothetical protein
LWTKKEKKEKEKEKEKEKKNARDENCIQQGHVMHSIIIDTA